MVRASVAKTGKWKLARGPAAVMAASPRSSMDPGRKLCQLVRPAVSPFGSIFEAATIAYPLQLALGLLREALGYVETCVETTNRSFPINFDFGFNQAKIPLVAPLLA